MSIQNFSYSVRNPKKLFFFIHFHMKWHNLWSKKKSWSKEQIVIFTCSFFLCVVWRPIGKYGNGKQVNDSLYVFDLIRQHFRDMIFFFVRRQENKIARQAYTMNVPLFNDSITFNYKTSQTKIPNKIQDEREKKIIQSMSYYIGFGFQLNSTSVYINAADSYKWYVTRSMLQLKHSVFDTFFPLSL